MDGGMSTALPTGFLEEVIRIAEQAGDAIMPFYRRDIDVEHKDDRSPVTEADRAADELIVASLQTLTPEIPVVSEESVAESGAPAITGERFWLVDPLDGTKEFIAGRDEFTVNIALIESGRPILGVVQVPALNQIYAADGPGRASARFDGEPTRHIAARAAPTDGLVAMVSRSHAVKGEFDDFFARYTIKDQLAAGSSLKFCRIAEGKADIYPRFGRTMEWDTAAGHAVLAAAGGSVRTTDGTDLLYGKPGFENPGFIARGRDS